MTGISAICRQNNIDALGWHVIMDGLDRITTITSLNGLGGLGGLFVGGQSVAELGDKDLMSKEVVIAVARLLRRSEATLTKLDLRSSVRNAKART